MIMRWLGTADDINVWQCPKCKDVRIEGKSGLGGSSPECGCDATDRVYLGRDEDSFYIRIPKNAGSTSEGPGDENTDVSEINWVGDEAYIAHNPDEAIISNVYEDDIQGNAIMCGKCGKRHDIETRCEE